MRTGNFFSTPLNGLVLGVFVGSFVVLGMTLAGFGGEDEETLPTELQTAEQATQARDNFVAAWERMSETTWLVESTFTRTLSNGQTFSTTGVSAQIPPNSAVDSNGSVSAIIDNRNIVCAAGQDGNAATCEERGEAAPFAERRDQQLESLRTTVDTAYAVQQRSGECFLLTASPGAIAAGATSQWGNRATFCFDETSGALDSTRFERDGGIDVTVATAIQDNITMNDLRDVLPAEVPAVTSAGAAATEQETL